MYPRRPDILQAGSVTQGHGRRTTRFRTIVYD